MKTKSSLIVNILVMTSMLISIASPALAAFPSSITRLPEQAELASLQEQDQPPQQQAPRAPAACALLDNATVRGLMSPMAESALLRNCGRASELASRPAAEAVREMEITLGVDVLVNDPGTDTGLNLTQSETTIARNPNTGTICSAFNDSGQFNSEGVFTGFSRSTDDGATFVDQGPVPLAGGEANYGDPSLVWRHADEKFYLTTLADNGSGGLALALFRSDDDCDSFTYVSAPSSTGNDDKEFLGVDNNPSSPYYGNLYVVWTDFSDGRITLVRSVDGGTTWDSPVKLSSSGTDVQGSWPAVAPNGDVYVGWVRWNPYPDGDIDIEITRSTDGGSSFTPVANPLTGGVNPFDDAASNNCGRPALNGDIRYLPSPQLVVSPDGDLHVVYVRDPDGHGSGDVINVYYRKSTDNGATWESEVLLSDDSTQTDQFFPTISVGPTGILVATWYDRRLDDPGNLFFDYFATYSVDGGNSWMANERISDVSSPVAVNFDPLIATCYHGDYDQTVVSEAFAYIQWSDDRNEQSGTNNPDIFFDKMVLLTDLGYMSGTVTDSSTGNPIEDASIFADGTYDFFGSTDANGYYTMTLAAGTYDVTASAYGYLPETVAGVEITTGETTPLDFSLDPAPMALVSGYVTDATTGWPLYASIAIPGVPESPIWTDPVTGYYEVSLPQGSSYDLTVNAWVPGYIPEERTIGPLGSDLQEDFELLADPAVCTAPGYYYETNTVFSENFESGYGDWSMTGLWNQETESSTCGSQVAPFPSPTHAAYYGIDGSCTFDTGETNSGNLTTNNTISLPAGYAYWLSASSYSETECGGDCFYDNRMFQISADGSNYSDVGEVDFEGTWGQNTYAISEFAGEDIYLRFRFDTFDSVGNDYFGWMLDDISIIQGDCVPAPGGLVVGNVYDANTLEGLNGAEVTNEGGYSIETQPTPEDENVDDGFYTIFSPSGEQTHTATMDGGYTPSSSEVNVIANSTVEQDFFLEAGWLSTDPDSLSATLNFGETDTQSIDLTNSGEVDANFSISEKDRGYVPAVQQAIPASDGNFLRGEAAPSLRMAPVQAAGVPPLASPNLAPLGTLAYSVEVANGYFTEFDLDVPEDLPNLAPFASAEFPGAGEFVDGYIYVVAGSDMYQLNLDGTQADLISITPPFGGQSYTGMALDPTDGTVYMASCDISTSYLYTIDLEGGIVTQIGEITGSPCTIGIAIDGAGDLYGFDIVNDTLMMIDKSSGASTQIGSIGFDANFGQGMGWDQATDTLYLAAFNNGTFQAELRIADRTSGNTTLVGVLGQNIPGGTAQLPFLGLPNQVGGDQVPWLSEVPISGTVQANSTLPIDVTFDANAVDQPGEYYADLVINNDTPYGKLTVPVTMTVIAPATWGKLEGDVTSLGYCDENPMPLAEAEVLIESSDGMTYTLMTDENGHYIRWLDEAGSPYTVTVSYPEHEDATAEDIVIVGGNTTTVDIALRWLEPCVRVSPDSFNVEISQGYTIQRLMTILNQGAISTTFEITEQDKGMIPQVNLPESQGNFPRGEAATSFAAAPGSGSGTPPLSAPILAPFGTLAYSIESANSYFTEFDLDVPEELPNLSPYVIQEFPGAGEYVDGFIYVIDGTTLYVLEPSGAVVDSLPVDPPSGGQSYTGMALDPTDGTVYLASCDIATSYLYTLDVSDGSVTEIGEITNSPCTIAIAVDGNGDMYSHDIVNDSLMMIDKNSGAGTVIGSLGYDANFGQGMGWDQATDTLYLAAFNNSTFQAELRTADRATGNTTLVGVLGSTIPGGLTQLPFLAIPLDVGGDVLWLKEEPVSGTIPADSAAEIEVTFDSMTYTVGTQLAALLRVKSDDPFNHSIQVPVTMTIVPLAYGVDVGPDQYQDSAPGQTITYTVRVTNTSTGPADSFTITLDSEAFPASLDKTVVGPLAPYETETVQVTVEVPAGVTDGTTDTVEVTATSQTDPSVSDTASLVTTVVGTFSLTLEPAAEARSGMPGETVIYTLTLTNTGDPTVVEVNFTDNTWDVHLPVTTFDLDTGESVEVMVHVTVPDDAVTGESDSVTITAMGSGGATAEAILTTSAVTGMIYLPLVMNGYNVP